MRMNQYSAHLKMKDGKEYTQFTIGKKVRNRLKGLLFCSGAVKVKETERFEHYEVEGNKMHFMTIA